MKINFNPIVFCKFSNLLQKIIKPDITQLIFHKIYNYETHEWINLAKNKQIIMEKLKKTSFFKNIPEKLIEAYIP